MDQTNLPQTLVTILALTSLCGCSENVTPNGNEGTNSTNGGSATSASRNSSSSRANDDDTSVSSGGTSDSVASGGRATTSRTAAQGGTVADDTSETAVGEGARGGRPTSAKSSTGGSKASASNPSGGRSGATGGSSAGVGARGGEQALGGSKSTADTTATTTPGGAVDSPGCGLTDYPAACSSSGSPCSVTVESTARTFYVYLPTNYDSSQPYPLVFQFHPMGGTAEQAINIPSIRSKFPAIYVTPQGLSPDGTSGWPNTNGQDMAFTKVMLTEVQEKYCVDKSRIFSTGFSYGGMMSFAIGCEMGDVFRAIAPMSGATYSGCKNGNHPVAMWGSHGISDNVVPIADGRKGRDAILSRNHCGTQTSPTTPSPCVSYEGCDSGYPTTWCEFEGSHAPPSFAAGAIVDFFKQF